MKKSRRNIKRFGRLVPAVDAFLFYVCKMCEAVGVREGRKLQNGTPLCGGKIGGGFARGYSLVETLMVVLIIGILTAVALPQYQRAVQKAEYARAQSAAATLARAEDIYYETYKQYTPLMENLDVTIDFTRQSEDCTDESASCYYYDKKGVWCTLLKAGYLYCRSMKDIARYYKYAANYSSSRAGKAYCRPMKDSSTVADPDDWSYKFCQRETGTTTPDSSGLFVYAK